MAIWLHRQRWIPESRRRWWSRELVSDLALTEVNAYHKFLWTNHLAYARTYEVGLRFGFENFNETRKMFLTMLEETLRDRGLDPGADVGSAFDVGCSLGYTLRYLETDVFPEAARLGGMDIDAHAIDAGRTHLEQQSSKIRLTCGDMEALDEVLGGEACDVILCLGTLMYLREDEAARVVRSILHHTEVLAGFAGLAHPEIDNSRLDRSAVRPDDRSFIHNLDRMIVQAGGTIVRRRWDGPRVVDGNTVYFVFAVGPRSQRGLGSGAT
jgi:SAM-dependent methyltransferase